MNAIHGHDEKVDRDCIHSFSSPGLDRAEFNLT